MLGELDLPRDKYDFYGLNVTEFDVNETLNATVESGFNVQIEVFTPNCGQNVVPASNNACNKGHCPPGHTDSQGNHVCSEHGHTVECHGESGVAGPGFVEFVPEQEGIYVIRVTIAPGDSPHNPGAPDPKNPDISGCHDFCGNLVSYDVSVPSDIGFA